MERRFLLSIWKDVETIFFSMPVSSVVFCMNGMSGRSVMGCCPSVDDG